jgi:hypothetical protein
VAARCLFPVVAVPRAKLCSKRLVVRKKHRERLQANPASRAAAIARNSCCLRLLRRFFLKSCFGWQSCATIFGLFGKLQATFPVRSYSILCVFPPQSVLSPPRSLADTRCLLRPRRFLPLNRPVWPRSAIECSRLVGLPHGNQACDPFLLFQNEKKAASNFFWRLHRTSLETRTFIIPRALFSCVPTASGHSISTF